MNRSILKWAALAVVAYVLWRLVRRGIVGATAAPPAPHAGAGAGGAHKPTPAPLIDPSTLPPPTMDHKVAADVENGDALARDFMADDQQFNKEGSLWTDFMQPAGRVRLFSDCPREIWRYTFGLMAMTLDRQLQRSRRWGLYNSNIVDQQTGQTVDSVVGGIVATVAGIIGGPVVGALIKYAVNTQVADLGAAIAQEGAVLDFAQRLRTNANPAKLPPSVIELLNGWANALPPKVVDSSTTRLGHALNMPDDVIDAIGLESPVYNAPPEPWHKPDGSTYFWPSSWFYLTSVGLLLPWVSSELIRGDWRETVEVRARVARCLDAFACMVTPHPPSEGLAGRFYYRNKIHGDILGSFFPPTDEDTHYIDAAGVVYDFNGRVIDTAGLARGAIAAISGSIAANVPGVVPTGPDSWQGNGEQFSGGDSSPPIAGYSTNNQTGVTTTLYATPGPPPLPRPRGTGPKGHQIDVG